MKLNFQILITAIIALVYLYRLIIYSHLSIVIPKIKGKLTNYLLSLFSCDFFFFLHYHITTIPLFDHHNLIVFFLLYNY